MSWSLGVVGRDPKEVEDELKTLQKTSPLPDHIVAAIDQAVTAFGAQPSIERDFHVSTNGHIGPDGLGSAYISISVAKRIVDATTEAGARELADKLTDQ